MNYTKLGIKSIGMLSAGVLAYDITKGGQSRGKRKARSNIANSLTDLYVNQQRATSSSRVLDATRKWYRKEALDDRFFTTTNKFTSIVKETCSKVVDNIVPIALSIGAIAYAGKSGLKYKVLQAGRKLKLRRPTLYLLKKMPKLNIKPTEFKTYIAAACAGVLSLRAASLVGGDALGIGRSSKI